MQSYLKLLSILLVTGFILTSSLIAQGQTDPVESFTNLFEEENPELTDDLKKRSYQDVRQSGNKIGYKMAYQMVLNGEPGMNFSFFVDIPFNKRWSVCIEGGPLVSRITSFKDRLGNVYPDDFMGALTNAGEGKYTFISFIGELRYFMRSFWIGGGFNYAFFAFGGLNYFDATGNNIYRSITRDDGAKDMFSVLLSLGYLAELKDNVFVAPEVTAGYNFVEGSSLSKKTIINAGFTLLFKL